MRRRSAALPLAAHGASPGRCLDGTPAIYYHAKGTGSGANKWFIHQQGGGWCYTEESCVGRSKMSLGSTKADPKTRTLNGGYMSWDNVSNPLMYNWVRRRPALLLSLNCYRLHWSKLDFVCASPVLNCHRSGSASASV